MMMRALDWVKTKLNKLAPLQRKIIAQGTLAVGVMLLTVVLLFAMTKAWYTNVIKTDGLVFEAAKWGFDGEVTLNNEVIKAYPGSTGAIELTIDNTADQPIATSVNISKELMSNEMKKRLYFYADTTKKKNGELMPRVYINSSDSYKYLVLSKATLQLSNTYSSDVSLKWEWVYDVLGYYCLGTVTPSSVPQITEILRPVEYSLDNATFTPSGDLLTVDGSTTTTQFLENLSKDDGYEGSIGTTAVQGYYPVSVDGNGQGVWVYLCNYSEIGEATAYDTELASAAEPLHSVAQVIITSDNAKQVETPVSGVNEFKETITSGEATVINLESDITLSEDLNLKQGQTVIDLNSHTLTLEKGSRDSAIYVGEGSSLAVVNGTIEGQAGMNAFSVINGELTVSGVDISGVNGVAVIQDNASVDSVTKFSGCNINTKSSSFIIRGNGEATAADSRLIIEDCTINSDYIGVVGDGNRNPQRYGTDIQIRGCTITGKWAGIYHPQLDGKISVYKSTISGFTGIAHKGGTLSLVDTTVSGTGTGADVAAPGFSKSGFVDTAAGISVETNYSGDKILEISGSCKITSVSTDALVVYNSSDKTFSAKITGGEFSSDVSSFLNAEYKCEKSGSEYLVIKK